MAEEIKCLLIPRSQNVIAKKEITTSRVRATAPEIENNIPVASATLISYSQEEKKDEIPHYISVSTCGKTYMLRSDGAVDMYPSASSSRHRTIFDPEVQYIAITAGSEHAFFLTSLGGYHRISKGKVIRRFQPDGHIRYTAMASSSNKVYFLRSDGAVDWMRTHERHIGGTLRASETNCHYVAIAARFATVYMLRTDGKVDVDCICTTCMRRGFACSDRQNYQKWKVEDYHNRIAAITIASPALNGAFSRHVPQHYILENGQVMGQLKPECIWRTRKVERQPSHKYTLNPPPGVRFISGSTAQNLTYLVRDDGVVTRLKDKLRITHEMIPPVGSKYIEVSASAKASYLLASNGHVYQTRGKGKVSRKYCPSTAAGPRSATSI